MPTIRKMSFSKLVMTLFWKFFETFRQNLLIFQSRTFWWSLGLDV